MSSEEDSRNDQFEDSSSSSEPDDEFMLKLYTGKLKQDKQYQMHTSTSNVDREDPTVPSVSEEVEV